MAPNVGTILNVWLVYLCLAVEATASKYDWTDSTYDLWVLNLDEECTSVADTRGVIKRCIADYQCAHNADKFDGTLLDNVNPRTCQKRRSRKKDEKCVRADANCKDGLYCKPPHGPLDATDTVAALSGVCASVLKKKDSCSLKDGTYVGCPSGYGCNLGTSATDGTCTRYFSQPAGTQVSDAFGTGRLFCHPWLWRNSAGKCSPVSEAKCDNQCSRADASGYTVSPFHDGHGEFMYRPYCELGSGDQQSCKVTGHEDGSDDCWEEFADYKQEDPLFPDPAAPYNPSAAYDGGQRKKAIDKYENWRKCVKGSAGFGEYIYPVPSKVLVILLSVLAVFIVIVICVVVGLIIYKKKVAAVRKEHYMGNFRTRKFTTSSKDDSLMNNESRNTYEDYEGEGGL